MNLELVVDVVHVKENQSVVLHRYRISNPYVLKYIDNPKFTQTAKSNLENKDSKTGVLNLQGCKFNISLKIFKILFL